MTLHAVISDVHANLFALEIVLRDIEKQGIPKENIICLGDIIGYGPQPFECANLVEERCGHNVKGNHETGFLEKSVDSDLILRSKGFSEIAANALNWTVDKFERIFGQPASRWSLFGKKDAQRKKESAEKGFDFIKQLPLDLELQIGDFKVYGVHANPLNPKKTNDYVFDPKLARKYGLEEGKYIDPGEILVAPQLQEVNLFVFGHTHERIIYLGDSSGHYKFPREKIRVSQKDAQGKRIMLNPGSIGYPRSSTKSISYAVFNPEAQGKEYLVEIIVMPYWEAVSQELEKAGLYDIFKNKETQSPKEKP